jgi:putative SOS response-associated peptidase YedK
MCYYNGRTVSYAEFVRLKNLEKQIKSLQNGKPVSKGFDYEEWPVIKPIGKYDFEKVEMEWGFIPDSWKGKKLDTREKVKNWRNGYKNEQGVYVPGTTTLNAMGEELLLPGKIYRAAALYDRCLVWSWGFYESKHIVEMGKRGKPLKQPYTIPHFIKLTGKSSFPMAGIWKPWKDAETGEYKETFAIVTAPANSLMEVIHNSKKRMPTILTQELAERWIFEDLTEEEITEIATFQYPAEKMEAYTVRKDFVTYTDPTEKYMYDEDAISGIPKDLFS